MRLPKAVLLVLVLAIGGVLPGTALPLRAEEAAPLPAASALTTVGPVHTLPAPGSQVNQAVSCTSDTCLIVLQDGRSGGWDIWGLLTTLEGVPLSSQGFVISEAFDTQEEPAVATDG